jgi:aerobic C4-dicarboxylate transport protein
VIDLLPPGEPATAFGHPIRGGPFPVDRRRPTPQEVAMTHAADPAITGAPAPPRKRWYRQLYVQVLVAIVIGIFVGWRWPDLGEAMQPIGTTFIAAMKMLIGPIVFLTIIGGIAGVADLKKVGMTGLKALTYFQIGTIIAMITGLVAIKPCPPSAPSQPPASC